MLYTNMNKGHVGDKINSAVLSFVERLYSFGGSKCIRAIGGNTLGFLPCVLCREVHYTVTLSTIGGSTIGSVC